MGDLIAGGFGQNAWVENDLMVASEEGAKSVLDKDRSPYFLRRMKESMKDFNGKPLFLPEMSVSVVPS